MQNFAWRSRGAPAIRVPRVGAVELEGAPFWDPLHRPGENCRARGVDLGGISPKDSRPVPVQEPVFPVAAFSIFHDCQRTKFLILKKY